MILVLLGTQDKSFHRLLEQVEKCIKDNIITEKVIIQAGFTKYKSDNMEIFDYVCQEKLNKYIDQANFIITHAGVGSILTCLKKNKKIIAAARLKKYKEHTNDHQLQILKEFDKKKYVLPLYDFTKLDKMIKKIPKFAPKPIKEEWKIEDIIEKYINENIKEVKK